MKFQEWFDLTIDQCIQNNATECDFTGDKAPYRELQLTFFCGNTPECRRVGSRDALAQVRKISSKQTQWTSHKSFFL